MTRTQRHRRLSHLFTIDAHIPKLDVAGSTPVSRSNFFNDFPPLRSFSTPIGESPVFISNLLSASTTRHASADSQLEVVTVHRYKIAGRDLNHASGKGRCSLGLKRACSLSRECLDNHLTR